MAAAFGQPPRYIALLFREHAVQIGAVDAQQRVVLTPRLVAHAALGGWARQHLLPTDSVVVGAPRPAPQIHDQLAPLAASVTVAEPQLLGRLQAEGAIGLARLHAAGQVPALWAPALRALRALTAERRRLLGQRADARQQLHELLRRYRLTPPGADRLAADRSDWWATRGLAPDDQVRAQAALVALRSASEQLAEAEQKLELASAAPPWAALASALMQTPGMQARCAIILLAEIGEISRFPRASQLVGYARLGGAGDTLAPPASASQAEIRATMLEIARAATRDDEAWRASFDALVSRIGRDRAIVACARKLLLLVWRALASAAEVDGRALRREAA